jgi:hypothetical protein
MPGEARKLVPDACLDGNNKNIVIGFAHSSAQTASAEFTEKEKRLYALIEPLMRLCSSIGFGRGAGKGESVRRWYPVYVRAETASGKGCGVEQQGQSRVGSQGVGA